MKLYIGAVFWGEYLFPHEFINYPDGNIIYQFKNTP